MSLFTGESHFGPRDSRELPTLRRYDAGKVNDKHALICKFPHSSESINKVRPCLPQLIKSFAALSPHVKYAKFFYWYDVIDRETEYRILRKEDEDFKGNEIHERQKSIALERTQVVCVYIAEKNHEDEAWARIQVLKGIIELHFYHCTFVLKDAPLFLAPTVTATKPSESDSEAIFALERFIRKYGEKKKEGD